MTSWNDNNFVLLDSDDEEIPYDKIDEYLAGTFTNKCKIDKDYYLSVMSIDIGILNLGISVSLVDNNYNVIDVIWIDVINITEFKCGNDCNMWHSRTYADWLRHVFAREHDFFDSVDVILIEKQPPQGLSGIEQIIFYEWRDKAVLIYPRSVQKYLCIGHLEYDQRKIASERIAKKLLPPNLQEQLTFYNRKHDIADSILFTKYWCNTRKKRQEIRKLRKRQKRAAKNAAKRMGKISSKEFFDFFRFVPSSDSL